MPDTDLCPAHAQVMDVRIIMDRNTRRSKGFAYIEMATRESIIPALSLAGQTLMGQSVMVKSSEVRYKTLPNVLPDLDFGDSVCSRPSRGWGTTQSMRSRLAQLPTCSNEDLCQGTLKLGLNVMLASHY